MRLYRVFPCDAGAAPSDPGGPLFVPPPSGLGRIDNPDLYDILYVSASAQAAVAGSFGRLAVWRPDTFVHGSGLPYALAVYEVPDDLPVFDTNDVDALKSIGVMRPTDVVTRDRETTQMWARTIFSLARYHGAAWWSYYNPEWAVLGFWERRALRLVGSPEIIEPASPVGQESAAAIVRQVARN